MRNQDRCALVARQRAHKYLNRIKAFPPSPPSIPSSPIWDDYEQDIRSPYHRDRVEAPDGVEVTNPRARNNHSKRRLISNSDESDFDIPIRPHTSKRRKHDEIDDITDELERSVADDNSRAPTPSGRATSKRGKGKAVEDMVKDVARRGKRKRNINELTAETFVSSKQLAPSEDGTPHPSAPNSPQLKTIYELTDTIPALRRPNKKPEGAHATRRIKAVEDAQFKVWTTIARKDIPKVDTFIA